MIVAISPGDGRDLIPWIESLGSAGLKALLLREPQATAEGFAHLVKVATEHVETVIIHSKSPRTAALPVHLASNFQGPTDRPWGRSCHCCQEVDRAFAAGASWASLSPVYSPTSKPLDTRRTLGVEAFLHCANGRNVWALGGITPETWEPLRGRAAGCMVLGYLFGAANPDQAADRLRAFDR